MATLVFLEHHGDELQKGSLGVLAKAVQLGGGDVTAVLVGGGVKALAAQAGKFGAKKVIVAEDASLKSMPVFKERVSRPVNAAVLMSAEKLPREIEPEIAVKDEK